MNLGLSCHCALAMRQRHLLRRRLERVATIGYRCLTGLGFIFIASIVVGWI